MPFKHQIVIIGGGNAGISVAAQLLRKRKGLDIAIIEPSERHLYQPALTLVGAGVFNVKKLSRREARLIPKGAKWIKERVTRVLPGQNEVLLESGKRIGYDYLVAAPGIQLNWNDIKGLKDTLGKNGVCSNYDINVAPYTFECLKNFKGGNAIFHNPETPVKCGGAPHKIMYIAADYFRKHKVLNKAKIQYWSGAARLFSVPKYENTLLKVCERANIQLNFMVKLLEVDGKGKQARFIGIGDGNKGQEYLVDFDMIHVTPPQSAPDFIRDSELANSAGWIDVDKHSLQHVKFVNVFSLGDAAGLPISKTGAAIRKQAPVVVANLLSAMDGMVFTARYEGYTSCPLVTGYGKLVMAEFDYNNTPQETFPFDQSKERWSMYQLKKRVLPWLYWHRILPGKM